MVWDPSSVTASRNERSCQFHPPSDVSVVYVVGDVGHNLQEWNLGTVPLVLVGWISLLYRIHAEEHILSQDPGWRAYVAGCPTVSSPGSGRCPRLRLSNQVADQWNRN